MTTASVSLHKSCTSSNVCVRVLAHTHRRTPLPPHYRPHPLKHISDSKHWTSFLHSAHTHAPDVSETFTDHMQAHTNMNTHRSIVTSTKAHTRAHITCGRPTPQRLPVPSPQLNSLFWQSTRQPEHWRQRQAHENTGSLGGWGSYAHLHSLARN